MTCKWHKCNNEARAKSPFCSGTCKKRYQRASGTNVPVEASGTKPEPHDAPQSTNSGAVVAEHPPRTKGTCIHCGRGPLGDITHYPDGSAICDKCKTEQRTRTVPIPGDADYEGCCHEVDGEWQVDNTKPDIKAMSTDELIRRLHYIKEWQRSPEHKEVMRRRRQEAA